MVFYPRVLVIVVEFDRYAPITEAMKLVYSSLRWQYVPRVVRCCRCEGSGTVCFYKL
jgi:hypothetical protein